MFDFLRRKSKIKENGESVQTGSRKNIDAAPEHVRAIPYEVERDGLKISFTTSLEGDDVFFFPRYWSFLPPHEQFRDRLEDSEREFCDVIWFLCLLYRNGMCLTSEPIHDFIVGAASWDDYYDFNCNGVPTRLFVERDFDNINISCNGFAVAVDHADQRNAVAEAIGDIIIKEGRSVTCEEWEKLKKDSFIKLK